MSDFAKTWDNMNLRERIAHLLADWQQSKNTNDPMVLRIAATMAHHQLEEADADIVALTAERDEARRDAERWQDDSLRLMKERNKAQDERDEARRMYCMAAYRLDPKGEATPMSIAHQHGWDCFRKDGGNA